MWNQVYTSLYPSLIKAKVYKYVRGVENVELFFRKKLMELFSYFQITSGPQA